MTCMLYHVPTPGHIEPGEVQDALGKLGMKVDLAEATQLTKRSVCPPLEVLAHWLKPL